MKMWIFRVAALAAAMCFGATTEDGVTKERRGALGPNDTVVTDVDTTGIVAARTYTKDEIDRRIATDAPVRSVNGRTGRVILGASDVGALPNNRDDLKASANFRNAVWDVQIRDGGCDTNTVDALANSAVVTNALTVATTNRVALLESSKADNSALAAHTANTDNPHAVTAAQVGAVGIGERIEFTQDMGEGLTAEAWFDPFLLALDRPNFGTAYHRGGYSTYYSTYNSMYGFIQIGIPEGISNYDGPGVFISFESTTKYLHHTIEQWNQDGSLYTLMYFPEGQQGTIALRDWQSLSAMLDSTNATTIATNPTFSNAVLAVGLNIDTNSVAVLNEIAATFGGFPLGAGETATTVGGLLAALAAAVAWLKKNKVGSFDNVGGASATVESGVAKLDGFFTESNSLLNGRLAYSRNATGLKDRAFNALTFDGTEYNLSTALAAVTPTASGQPRDLLIVATATAATTISFTAGTIKGDKPTIDGSGTWLITLTEYASGVWYCRQIKMEDAA